MNKSIKFLLVAVAAISMASCSTGYYLSNSQNVNLSQTQVVLSQANFQVVKQVKVTYVYKNLHSMRFNASQMKESAYAALVKEAKLTGAQTIINVTMEQVQRQEHNFASCLFRLAPKYEQAITVSGTVIEFLPAGVAPTHSAVVESYIYGEPFAESDNNTTDAIQSTDNNPTIQDTIPDNNPITQDTIHNNKPITQGTIPADSVENTEIDFHSDDPSYMLLKEHYRSQYPKFWDAIVVVRTYCTYKEKEKITQLLLSDNEELINGLMQEVLAKGNMTPQQMVDIFLRYAQRQK